MIPTAVFWGNVHMGGKLEIDANRKSNFEIFENALVP